MAQVTSLSSTGTAAIYLNPVPRTTSLLLSAAAGSSGGVVTLEVTLDDPSTTPAPTITWSPISSGAAMLSSNVTGLLYTVLSPIGGARINSTAIGNATFTLKAHQSVTG